jgi:hypothetical protein
MQTDDRAKISLQTIEEIVSILAGENKAKATNAFKRWLHIQTKFYRYSWQNVMLIASQAKKFGFEPTVVAGSNKWKKLFDRQINQDQWVNKIWILAPIKSEDEKDKGKLIGYRSVYVFDQAQTNGKEIPTINRGTEEGRLDDLFVWMKKVYKADGIELNFEGASFMKNSFGGADGAVITDKSVCIQKGLKGVNKVAAMVRMYAKTKANWGLEVEAITKEVLQSWGFDYELNVNMNEWATSQDEIKKSFEFISSTAKKILA